MSSVEERLAIVETRYSNVDKLLVDNFKKFDNYFEKIFEWQNNHTKEHNAINRVLDTFENSLDMLKTSHQKEEEMKNNIRVGRKIANWTSGIMLIINIIVLFINYYLLNTKGLL